MRNKISVSKNQNNCLLSNRINSLSHKHVSSNLSYSVIYCFLWFFKFWVIVLKIIIKNLQITNITLSTINETQRLHISFYFYMVRQLILRLWSYWLDFTLFTIKWSFMNLSTTKNWKKILDKFRTRKTIALYSLLWFKCSLLTSWILHVYT